MSNGFLRMWDHAVFILNGNATHHDPNGAMTVSRMYFNDHMVGYDASQSSWKDAPDTHLGTRQDDDPTFIREGYFQPKPFPLIGQYRYDREVREQVWHLYRNLEGLPNFDAFKREVDALDRNGLVFLLRRTLMAYRVAEAIREAPAWAEEVGVVIQNLKPESFAVLFGLYGRERVRLNPINEVEVGVEVFSAPLAMAYANMMPQPKNAWQFLLDDD